MTVTPSRRTALKLAGVAGLTALLGADGASFSLHRRLGVAFGTTVSLTVAATDAAQAEAAFAAAFPEIRAVDRAASLTDPRGELFRLNRDGRLSRPSTALLEMLAIAARMNAATQGAFDVTIQPLWLAIDAAAKAGGWLEGRALASASARVDQGALAFDEGAVRFLRPGMGATLNSLARGLAADRVAAALRRVGVAQAMFDTDVLGAAGRRLDGEPWLARVRHPRQPQESVAFARVEGFLATSGDYAYAWSDDYARNHILDPRRGVSPSDFASVTVKAPSGLLADALSTAAFLSGRDAAVALLSRFGAEALFVTKAGAVSQTPGFPLAPRSA